MSASDQLSVIAEKLEALPDRLAAVLGGQASGQAGSARSSAGTDGSATGGGALKAPRAWTATENLLGSLGGIAPIFGKAAGAMRKVDDLGRSATEWHESVFGNQKGSGSAATQAPTVARARQTTLSSASQPSVMNATRLAHTASSSAFQSTGGNGQASPQIQGISELNRTMQELNASLRQLKDSMDQLDPEPHQDAEQAENDDKSLWQQSMASSPGDGDTASPFNGSLSQRGPLRPSQDVPSAEQATKGESGGSTDLAMLAARFYAS